MRHLLLDALDSVPCFGEKSLFPGVGSNKDEDLNVFGSMVRSGKREKDEKGVAKRGQKEER